MLGAVEDLRRLAKRRLADRSNEPIGVLPPRSIEIRCNDLQKQIEMLYEHLFAGSVAEDAAADAELLLLGQAPLRSEDFGHRPYRFPFDKQER